MPAVQQYVESLDPSSTSTTITTYLQHAQVEALARLPSATRITRLHSQSSNAAPTLPPKGGERTLQGPPPTDWCLKSVLRITADGEAVQHFLWEVATRSAGMAQPVHMGGMGTDAVDTGRLARTSEVDGSQYASGIHWWQHPAERWEGGAISAMVQSGHAAMMARR